jgi:hypothetical protein
MDRGLTNGQLMDRSSSWMLDDEQILHTAQRLLVKLAQMSGTFAPSLFIDDVKKPIAISCGAFADIYRAQRLTGKEVALKKLRVFQVHERAKIHNVRSSLCCPSLLLLTRLVNGRCSATRRYSGSNLSISISYLSLD